MTNKIIRKEELFEAINTYNAMINYDDKEDLKLIRKEITALRKQFKYCNEEEKLA